MEHGPTCLHCQIRGDIRTRLDNGEDANDLIGGLVIMLAEFVASQTSKQDRDELLSMIIEDLPIAVDAQVKEKFLQSPGYREETIQRSGGMN